MKKYRKFWFFITIPLFISNSFAQQKNIIVDSKEYQQYKKAGTLDQYIVTQPHGEKILDLSKVLSGKVGQYTATPKSATQCDCMIPLDGTFNVVPFLGGTPPLYRNDDGSSPLINLPFSFCLYGTQYNSVYINNNGNVSFGAPYATFTSTAFPTTQFTMVAPFWGDVDTRNPASGVVYYKITPTHMIVRWNNVGYYNQHVDKINDFQLIITNGNDPIVPSGNVMFCYGDMQWTTGDASQGQNGFGGTPATVGANAGNGTSFIQFGRFDQPGTAYDGPFGANDGVSWLDYQSFYFDACGSGSNIAPIATINISTPSGTSISSGICDTTNVCENDTILINATFLAPENNQTVSITTSGPQAGNFTVLNNVSGPVASLSLQFIGTSSNLGVNTITITATDNGTPVGNTQITLVFNVIPAPVASAVTYTASCANNDGSVVLSGTGGVSPYQYSINGVNYTSNDSITNLAAGSYIGYVRDTIGCRDTVAFTISNPFAPTIDSVHITNILCHNDCNGEITVFCSPQQGGTLSYSWNTNPIQTTPTISNLCSGTYVLTLTETYASGGLDTVWQENFNTAANWNLSFPTGFNAANANFWVVNDNEGGVLPPGCGVANNGNNTLHITSQIFPNAGAAYNAGGLCPFICVTTNTMAHTNNISTVGYTNLTLSFNFISNGQGLIDNLSLMYNTGSGWQVLDPSLKSQVCGNGQGQWTAYSINLPPSCNNIPNLQIGFNWTNNDDGVGTDPSAAIDNILITSSSGGPQTCSITQSFTLANPSALVLSTVVDSVSCGGYSDGSITVNANGGTPGYTYSFDGGVTYGSNNVFNNLTAGTYTIFVRDTNGCTQSIQATVNQPTPISSIKNNTNVSCFGGNNGTASVVVSGGTPAYTYSWNTTPPQTTATANNLSAGTYIVTITDANGCQKQDTIVISQPSPLVLLLNSTINRCGHTEGTASVSISGGTPTYSVVWNTTPPQTTNTATGLTGGTYTATVTDANGCILSDSIVVNETLGITADFSASTIFGDAPLFVQFNNNTTGSVTTYTWDFGNGVFDSTNISPSYTFTEGGMFNVILYACYTPQCCDSASLTIEVLDSLQTFNVFTPNGDGKNDVFTIKFKDASSVTMTVFNRWGEKVHEETAITPSWDGRKKGGAQCPDGTYFYIINATRRDGKTYEHKGMVTLIR
jgi:gliding motility-associated-like protein